MNIWLLFLLKSTLILSTLYVFFRLAIRKEPFFLQSRIALVLIVLFSVAIPLIYIPASTPSIVPDSIEPTFIYPVIEEPGVPQSEALAIPDESTQAVAANKRAVDIPAEGIVLSIYLIGAFISFCLFAYRLNSVLQLIRKSEKRTVDGIRLNLINNDIPAFSFGKSIVMSSHDYKTNSEAILTHELSHVRQGHFYDLMLMELVKIIYWFNPLAYYMNSDMKEIHEYQADDHTLKSGIDAINYQLLIIQKSVGAQRFALANSFNHCQIKNRITMMNKSKNRKSWNWKVATFLPLLVVLLMAFSRKGENPPEITNSSKADLLENMVPTSESTQKQFEEFKQKIEIRKDGNYINNKLVTLAEIKEQDKKWRGSSNDWIFLMIDESIPLKRIDEVRESLEGPYWVVQATVNSDDLIYFAGDVNKLAEFKNGKLHDWLKNQLEKYPEAKSISESKTFKLSYSFIVDKNGQPRDGHVIEECQYSELNIALNKILSQMPDWEPAIRGNEKVSVYWKVMMLN